MGNATKRGLGYGGNKVDPTPERPKQTPVIMTRRTRLRLPGLTAGEHGHRIPPPLPLPDLAQLHGGLHSHQPYHHPRLLSRPAAAAPVTAGSRRRRRPGGPTEPERARARVGPAAPRFLERVFPGQQTFLIRLLRGLGFDDGLSTEHDGFARLALGARQELEHLAVVAVFLVGVALEERVEVRRLVVHWEVAERESIVGIVARDDFV